MFDLNVFVFLYGNWNGYGQLVTGLHVILFCLLSDSWLTNRTPASRSSDFVYHSYDNRPNWTPLGPITSINSVITILLDYKLLHRLEKKGKKKGDSV